MALPTIDFAAPLLRAAIATLQADMPGQVALFNAEPANEVEIVAPQTYHFGGQDMLAAFAYPQIEVAAVTGDTGEFAVGRAAVDHDVRVNVALWLEGIDGGGDIPTLYEQTLGLARCVIECLAGERDVGGVRREPFGPGGIEIAQDRGVSWRIDVIPFDPTALTPAQGREFQRWLGSALVQFRLETIESLT